MNDEMMDVLMLKNKQFKFLIHFGKNKKLLKIRI